VLIVTGPNMGGKSTYLRQAALVVLLAQAGSFVPAERATIGLVDRLFTRVGSQDDLVAGASTFLVEMAETANILRHATARSLVVLDEVGRGTSTHDGLCIAQAVLEHIHDRVGARTLFATHFHELTSLAESLHDVRNVTVAVDEADEGLAFLYRVVPGAANRSYGVQVARLAGLPDSVTARAAELLRVREAPVFEEVVGPDGADDNGPIDATPLLLDPFDLIGGAQEALTPRPPLPRTERGGGGAAPQDWGAGGPPGEQGLARVAEVSELLQVAESPPPYLIAEVDHADGHAPSDVLYAATPTPAPVPGPAAPPTSPAAARLLGELLSLDLSNLTPLQALIRLHQLQETARGSVPWQAWLADLAGGDGAARQAKGPGQPSDGTARQADQWAQHADGTARQTNGRAGRP